MTRSSAVVATDRPARYAKQLCSHLGRKAQAEWDAEAGEGRIVFGGGVAECTLKAAESGLQLGVEAPAEELDRFENVVGCHLVRFGAKDELVCVWEREDGTPGTKYRNDG